AADSRPNWHSARDIGGPTVRGDRVLLRDPPPLAPTAGSASAMVLASYRCQPQAAKAVRNRASQAERDEPPLRHRARATPQDPYPAGHRLRFFYGRARFDDDRGGDPRHGQRPRRKPAAAQSGDYDLSVESGRLH